MSDRKPHVTAEKKQEVAALAETLKNTQSAIFVSYTGLTVKTQQDLKKKLALGGGTMFVAKNTLLRLAAREAGYPEEAFSDDVLSGQTALVISSEDAIAPLQILGKFIKENEMPSLKVGVVEGRFQDKESLVKLSTLPGREVLYAQVVGAVAAPMYAVVGTLQANIQKLLLVLNSKILSSGHEVSKN